MTQREDNARLSESRDHRSAQRRRETPSAPVLTRQRDRGRGNRADQGARLIRGIGQKSVVRIFGSSISFASHSPEPYAGPPADLVTKALTRRATRARTGIHKMSVFGSPRGGSSRGEGASRTGARFGRPWCYSHCLSNPESTQVFAARHDGTRPAHARWRLTRVLEWELGSRRSDSPDIGASRCSAQEAAVWQSDPNRAVPARMTTDARGSVSAERGSSSRTPMGSARGVGTGAKSSTARTSFARRSTARCLGTTGSTEAGAPYGAPT